MITSGQVEATTGTVTLCRVPPGPCVVMLSNAGTASPVYVGAGPALSSANGFPVPSGVPVAFPGYQGSAGGTLYATCSSGSASLGWLISDCQ